MTADPKERESATTRARYTLRAVEKRLGIGAALASNSSIPEENTEIAVRTQGFGASAPQEAV